MSYKLPPIGLVSLITFIILSCTHGDGSTERLSMDSFNPLPMETVFELAESDDFAFRYIQSVQLDNHGNILISDPSQPVVYMFNRKGKLVQKISKEGKGPGEFQRVGSVLASHDSLAISDAKSQKIEVFHYRNGKYSHSRSVSLKNNKLVGNLLGLTEKGILAENNFRLIPAPPTEIAVSFLDRNGAILQDTLFSVPIHEFVVHNSEPSFVRGKIYGNTSKLAYDESADKIYSLWTETLSVDYFTLDGKKHRAFSYPLEPVRITEAEHDSALNNLDKPKQKVMREHMPDVKPVAGDLVVDDQQRLWVELQSEPLDHGWYAFSPEGEPLFRIKNPHHNATLQDIHGNTILWNYTDEKGVPNIVKSKTDIPEI